MTADDRDPPGPDRRQDLPAGSAGHAVGASTKVILESGRWVVYLSVDFWEPDEDENPIAAKWMRIADYSDQRRANVVAHWMQQAADRPLRPPTGL